MNKCQNKGVLFVLLILLVFGFAGCTSTKVITESSVSPIYITNVKKFYLLPPACIENDVDIKLLSIAMSKLSKRERSIISMRFGIGCPDSEEKTQKEVADLLGISQSYISRLEKKIIKKLKKEMIKLQA